MVWEEGMSLTVETQQIPKLSIKGLEERQVHHPSGVFTSSRGKKQGLVNKKQIMEMKQRTNVQIITRHQPKIEHFDLKKNPPKQQQKPQSAILHWEPSRHRQIQILHDHRAEQLAP